MSESSFIPERSRNFELADPPKAGEWVRVRGIPIAQEKSVSADAVKAGKKGSVESLGRRMLAIWAACGLVALAGICIAYRLLNPDGGGKNPASNSFGLASSGANYDFNALSLNVPDPGEYKPNEKVTLQLTVTAHPSSLAVSLPSAGQRMTNWNTNVEYLKSKVYPPDGQGKGQVSLTISGVPKDNPKQATLGFAFHFIVAGKEITKRLQYTWQRAAVLAQSQPHPQDEPDDSSTGQVRRRIDYSNDEAAASRRAKAKSNQSQHGATKVPPKTTAKGDENRAAFNRAQAELDKDRHQAVAKPPTKTSGTSKKPGFVPNGG